MAQLPLRTRKLGNRFENQHSAWKCWEKGGFAAAQLSTQRMAHATYD
jgi:hypothetical protein